MVLLHYEDKSQTKDALITVQETELTPGGLYVLECLKQWRTEKAEELNVPKFMVCHNSELINIAFHHPKDREALKNIKGFGSKKIEKFEDEIIGVLNVV
ncbi:MAG TPA: HRDC domain-containing protein [Flavobacterium sp.]|uniref:HRDC domain-containing protein n=1 Tax=Flavobacterium sp. TaxID=239 RepID=UPI002C42020D|nr:HRDC domain-containing protein [Flavobacterium sp.]HSD15050.1 HRDC domain-containing protein [Flavobacterium sp.]